MRYESKGMDVPEWIQNAMNFVGFKDPNKGSFEMTYKNSKFHRVIPTFMA